MTQSHKILRSIFIAGASLLVTTTMAQNITSETLQPAQGAQMTVESSLPATTAPAPEAKPSRSEKKRTSVPQLVIPETATKKQARRLEKINKALEAQAEAIQNGEVKEPTKLQKAAAKMAIRKMEKKLQKAGVQETDWLKATEDQSSMAAQEMNKLTLIGIILMGAGLLFLFIIPIVGLLFLIGGLVCLIMGVAQM